jgi:hypothetical protein
VSRAFSRSDADGILVLFRFDVVLRILFAGDNLWVKTPICV